MAQALTLIDDGDSRPDDEVEDVTEDDYERIRLAGALMDATAESIERALRAYEAGVELQTALTSLETA